MCKSITTLIVILLLSITNLTADNLIPYRKGDLWGFSNEKAEIIIQPEYEYVDFFSDGLAIVGKNLKFGFINNKGTVVVPIKYESASDFKLGIAAVMLNGKYAIIDKNGKLLSKFKYTQYAYSETILKVKNEEGWGVFSPTKSKEVIANKYEQIGIFKNELDLVWIKKDKKIGVISLTSGQELITPKYDKILSFENGFAVVESSSLLGVINNKGEEIIPTTFEYIPSGFSFSRPLQKNDKWFFVNSEGKTTSELYDTAGPLYNGLAEVSLNGKFGFINSTGNLVIPLDYDAVGKPEEGLIAVKQNGKWGFIDYSNQLIMGFYFDDFPESKYQMHFAEGLSKVKEGGKVGFIDTLGSMVISSVYDDATPFFNDFSLVKQGGFYGIINSRGKEVIPVKYSKIHYFGLNRYFDNGIAIVAKGDKWGFVNDKGEELTAFVFDAPELQDNLEDDFNILPYQFFEGLCRVSVKGKIGFINSKGQDVVVPQYKEAQDFENGLAAVRIKDKWGFINKRGDLVTSYRYSDFYSYDDSNSNGRSFFRVVESRNLWGLLAPNGKELIPCKYDNPLTWENTFKKGLMWVFYQGKDGYVSAKGVEFFED